MRVFFNEDWIHFLWSRQNEKITEKELKDFIFQYKNTTITDFAFNVNGTVSSSPSAVLETWIDKYNATEENGEKVDYKNTFCALAYDLYERQKIDVYQVWFETCKEVGINPWLSFRMNDCHASVGKNELRKSTQVEKFSSSWISAHRKSVGYFDCCYDYSKKCVRDLMLAYIKEQVERYDAYGIELDFSREAYCFPVGKAEEGQAIMFDFINNVREILLQIGNSRAKKIYLSVIGQANPLSCLRSGFDFSSIAKAGLIDYFVAAPRWETTNTDIPIELWKQLLSHSVKFGCSQGLLVNGYIHTVKIADVATDMGQAVANAHRGCDFIYLYNHFDIKEPGFENISHENDFRQKENIRYIYENIGKVEDYEKWERRIPVTHDDATAMSEGIFKRFPLRASLAHFRIPCGKMDSERNIYIHIVTNEDVNEDNILVYANQKQAILVKDSKDEIVWAKGKALTYCVQIQTDKILGVEVLSTNAEQFTINYVDALIPPLKTNKEKKEDENVF